MSQHFRFDASRSLTSLEQDSTIVAVIEMSHAKWLVAALVPGVERQPLKKFDAQEEMLLMLLHRWRCEAGQAGRNIKRIVVAFEAGRDATAHRDRRHNTEGGLDRVDPGDADKQGAADDRPPAVFARAHAIASQADEAVEMVGATLDRSSHRDRAGGRRITVSTSDELRNMVDELAATPGRPSRSNGGQHRGVVAPRVEASPDRSDFAKLGETISTSLVQAAQEQANRANVLLEQTKQFADDIRSQVAGRELAEMNELLMAFGSLLAW